MTKYKYILLLATFLTGCSIFHKEENNKTIDASMVRQHDENYRAGDIQTLISQKTMIDMKKKNKILNKVDFGDLENLSDEEIDNEIIAKNFAANESYKSMFDRTNIEINYVSRSIPKYDFLHEDMPLNLSEADIYSFEQTKHHINARVLYDAKSMSRKEKMYFLKNERFVLEPNKYIFNSYYPCADISNEFVDGSIRITREILINSSLKSAYKNRNGYTSISNNKLIRYLIDNLKDVPKIDTGWYVESINCENKRGEKIKVLPQRFRR